VRIHIIAVGSRMPPWVEAAYGEYAKRMPAHCRLKLHEISAARRPKGADIARALRDECIRVRAAVPPGCRVIALERTGRQRDTGQIASALRSWFAQGQDTAFMIGPIRRVFVFATRQRTPRVHLAG